MRGSSIELATGHGVGAAGVGRRRAVDEPDRGLAAGPRDLGAGVSGLAGEGTDRTIGYVIAHIGTARDGPEDRPAPSLQRRPDHASMVLVCSSSPAAGVSGRLDRA